METETQATPRRSFAAMLAFLGCMAVAVSMFLPWLALGATQRSGLGVSEGDLRALEEAASERGEDTGEALAIVRRLRAGEAATGREWQALFAWTLEHAEEKGEVAPRERRAYGIAHAALAVLPWLAAGLALALLVLGLRKPPSWAIALLMVVGLLIGGLGGLLWLGASVQAKENAGQNIAALGVGLKLLAIGGLACLAGALFGVTSRTWWRGWGLGLLLAGGIAAFAVLHVRG